jgi:DnaA regulatory inactivator Hda
MATQQTFPIDFTPSYGRKNFIEASCNTIALQTIEQWPNWPSYGLVVYGPKGSGKTHLAHIFSQKAGAVFLGREKLRDPKLFVTLPPAANVIVDEVDVAALEEPLFHLLNFLKNENGTLLMTAENPPAEWPVKLPDLRSRILALNAVAISPPDDELLKAVMTKLFSDRQLYVEGDVVDYATTRLDRNFTALMDFVDKIDAASLRTKRRITLPLAREILAQSVDIL